MSFGLVCGHCGAPSGPAVGVCPYCKSVFTGGKAKKEPPTVSNIRAHYDKGELDRALSLAVALEKGKPDLLLNPRFALLFAQILIETEGPSSKARAVLQKALLEHPGEAVLQEYLELLHAKANLCHGRNDAGEGALKNILQRNPHNAHAAFLLGSHLFWVEGETRAALVHLERAVKNRPNFLRALACLAALYREMGAVPQARKLFQRCAALEKEPVMKKNFLEWAKA